MFFEDMSSYTYYLNSPIDNVKNIGWLAKNKPYKKGKISPEFLQNLFYIILGNKHFNTEVNRARSCDPCELCDSDINKIMKGGHSICLGASEIWIPSCKKDYFFASPSMIYHHVRDHGYYPPEDFISAVVNFDFEQNFNAQEIYLNLIKGHF